MKTVVKAIVVGGYFDRINSHWCYNTENFKVLRRCYADQNCFKEELLEALRKEDYNTVCFSGKDASEIANRIDALIENIIEVSIKLKYKKAIKVVRIQNTNLPLDKSFDTIESVFREYNENLPINGGRDWFEVCLGYPFDIIFTQTYGNDHIINKILHTSSAIYLPFAYNDKKFFPRNNKKNIDIGMYFKMEGHPQRIEFVNHLMKLIIKNGWKFEFSNAFWGESYAEHICNAKIILHYSKVGDVPYRLYETAGSRAFFLTDPLGFGVENIFVSGKHFIEYDRDLSNLEMKINWYLNNPVEREQISENAYQYAKSTNTWEIMAEKIVVPNVLKKLEKVSGFM